MLVTLKVCVALFTSLQSESTVDSWLYVQSDDKNVGPRIKPICICVLWVGTTALCLQITIYSRDG
jgi:hypothetical protein